MEYKYLIVDGRGNSLVYCESEKPPSEETWTLYVPDGDIDELMELPILRVIGYADLEIAMEGHAVGREGNTIYVDPIRPLSEAARQNLRVPVRFSSFIYSISGLWRGREPIVSKDLSCGGLAFYCPRKLAPSEVVEVVIPVTSQPLVLPMRILRIQSPQEIFTFYAGAFLNLVREQEAMIREAVFSLQLRRTEKG